MSPNPFTLVKLAVSPHKWVSRRPSSTPPTRVQEHWDTPLPGIYEYKPARGWYLISIDHVETAFPDSRSRPKLPAHLTYCKVLHRYMFQSEYNERRRFERIPQAKGEPKVCGFFRLDDEVTYVQCWDSEGTFVPGPYERWFLDKALKHMRPMKYKHVVIEGEERESRRSSWEKSQRVQVQNISEQCSSCGSPRAGSIQHPNLFERKASVSTAPGSTRGPSTTATTPGNGYRPTLHTDEVSATELKMRLMELDNA